MLHGSFRGNRGNSRSEIHLIHPTTTHRIFSTQRSYTIRRRLTFCRHSNRAKLFLAFVCESELLNYLLFYETCRLHMKKKKETSVGCNRSPNLLQALSFSLFIYINIHRVARENSCNFLSGARAARKRTANQDPRRKKKH